MEESLCQIKTCTSEIVLMGLTMELELLQKKMELWFQARGKAIN